MSLWRLLYFAPPGPDGIPGNLLKIWANEIADVLTLLFQSSQDQGCLSSDCKQAHIVPVFKKGDRGSVENYRSISLTSVTSKILEHIVHSSIMNHLDKHSSLNTFQHGFRQKRSCETQLADCLNGKGQIDAVLLDFSKAFDKVDNEKLLTKLHSLGIGDLHVLQAWEPENKLEFHPDKCQVLRITIKKAHPGNLSHP